MESEALWGYSIQGEDDDLHLLHDSDVGENWKATVDKPLELTEADWRFFDNHDPSAVSDSAQDKASEINQPTEGSHRGTEKTAAASELKQSDRPGESPSPTAKSGGSDGGVSNYTKSSAICMAGSTSKENYGQTESAESIPGAQAVSRDSHASVLVQEDLGSLSGSEPRLLRRQGLRQFQPDNVYTKYSNPLRRGQLPKPEEADEEVEDSPHTPHATCSASVSTARYSLRPDTRVKYYIDGQPPQKARKKRKKRQTHGEGLSIALDSLYTSSSAYDGSIQEDTGTEVTIAADILGALKKAR